MSNSLNIEASVRDADVVIERFSSRCQSTKLVTVRWSNKCVQALSLWTLPLTKGGVIEDSWPYDNARWTCLWKIRRSPLCRCQHPWCSCPYFNHRPNQCHSSLYRSFWLVKVLYKQSLKMRACVKVWPLYQGYLTSLPVAQGLDKNILQIGWTSLKI